MFYLVFGVQNFFSRRKEINNLHIVFYHALGMLSCVIWSEVVHSCYFWSELRSSHSSLVLSSPWCTVLVDLVYSLILSSLRVQFFLYLVCGLTLVATSVPPQKDLAGPNIYR